MKKGIGRKVLGALCVAFILNADAVWQPYMLKTADDTPGKFCTFTGPFGQVSTAHRSYNSTRAQQPLEQLIFGKTFTIGDIFLASKLAAAGSLSTGGVVQYDDSWLGTLAAATVGIEAQQTVYRFGLRGSFTVPRDKEDGVTGTVGFVLPFEYYRHSMLLSFPDAQLGDANGPPANALDTFLQNYGSPRAFFEKILRLKGLDLKERQVAFGLGPIQLYGVVNLEHYAKKWQKVEKLQVGGIVQFQSTSKPNANLVWPIERGPSNATQLGAYANVTWGGRKYFNPYITFRTVGSFYRTVTQRVPKKVVLAAGSNLVDPVMDNNVIAAGAVTTNVAVDQWDTTIPFFSDTAISVKRKIGTQVNFTVGDRIDFDPFYMQVWYYFSRYGKNKMKAAADTPAGTYDYTVPVARTDSRRHSIGFDLNYNFGESSTFAIGTQCVVKGKNAPQYHTLILTVRSTF